MAVGEVMRMEVPTGGDLTVSSPDLHVLAVDDSIVDRKVIERLLRISSCKVTTVESGTRALQYLGLDGNTGASDLKDLKVNLIVTDYSMPGLTGYDLLKKIKESSTFREIPVVIMSSENILTRIEQCLKEGAEDFLLKPVKLADVKRIKQLIMRNEAEDHRTLSHSNKRKLGEDVDTSPSSSHDYSSVKDFPSSKRMKTQLLPPDSGESEWGGGSFAVSSPWRLGYGASLDSTQGGCRGLFSGGASQWLPWFRVLAGVSLSTARGGFSGWHGLGGWKMIRFSGSQRRNVRLSLGFYGHEETFTSPVAALLSVAIPVAILIVSGDATPSSCEFLLLSSGDRYSEVEMRLFFASELLLLSPVSLCCLGVSPILVLRFCCHLNQLPMCSQSVSTLLVFLYVLALVEPLLREYSLYR
ncbi:hypothetical protein YC2023_096856 [Brassica napus]